MLSRGLEIQLIELGMSVGAVQFAGEVVHTSVHRSEKICAANQISRKYRERLLFEAKTAGDDQVR